VRNNADLQWNTETVSITFVELERVGLLPVPRREGDLGVGALQEILVENNYMVGFRIGPVVDEVEIPWHGREGVEQVCSRGLPAVSGTARYDTKRGPGRPATGNTTT
jgi:hypothetical protein